MNFNGLEAVLSKVGEWLDPGAMIWFNSYHDIHDHFHSNQPHPDNSSVIINPPI
jgi:hypothetical protein